MQLSLAGQAYYFRHYSVENGLSNNAVVCSLQDQMGFMWFGTKDGLNRFDGYAFKTFRKNSDKPGSIGNNSIHFLFEDKENVLWIATDKGLYQYIREKEEFKLVPSTANLYISKIAGDSFGNLWIITRDGLFRYQSKSFKLERYSQKDFFTPTSLCIGSDGIVWIGTSTGHLMQYHPGSNSFSGFDLFSHSKRNRSKWIESLYETSEGKLLAGTSLTDVKLIDASAGLYQDISLPDYGKSDLYIRSIQQTAPAEFWFGTESGIYIYNSQTSQIDHLKKRFNDPYSLTDNAIYAISKDREGGIWVGTYFGGLNYLPKQQTVFTRYFPQQGDNSIGGNVVREITKDKFGNLWIGTEDAGLNKLDTKTGKITKFLPGTKKGSISFFNIHGLYAKGNDLWVGTFNHGLDIMDIRTGKVKKHYEADRDGFTHNFIYCIHEIDSGKVLIGTPRGIFAYNSANDTFEVFNGFPVNTWYTSIVQDDNGTIWAGTLGNGLYFHNPSTGKTGSFKHIEAEPNSISNNRINDIYEDKHGTIWIATEEGLCRWNGSGNSFRNYNIANGFPSDFILSIIEDNLDHLWVSTTRGLVNMDPLSGKLIVFNVANGILSDQFNYNSAYKDDDGRLYFGSTKGLISFMPSMAMPPANSPNVYITGFQVNNEEIDIGLHNSPLEKSISYTESISLSHNQSSFSIDFAALSFAAPEMIQYAYWMEGLSQSWVSVKKNRRIYFNELTPGSYTFNVRVRSNDGSVHGPVTKLIIEITPAWYNSHLAYALYSLLAVSIIVYIFRLYHNWLEEKSRRKLELLQNEKEKEVLKMQLANEKEVLQAKIDFFTNVAHEIKTPLTLIKAPLKIVTEEIATNARIEHVLQIMNRNTNRLIDLTNQLLDFRQTEISEFHLSFERVEIVGLLKEASTDFAALASQTNIAITLNTLPEESFFATIDLDAFKKIMYNLLSNAVKYANTSIIITLVRRFEVNSFSIRIQSDGYLIPDNLKEKIFEPFFRVRETESQTGTGIGLALSRSLALLHNGSLIMDSPEDGMNVFLLTLPIVPDNVLKNDSDQSKTPDATQ